MAITYPRSFPNLTDIQSVSIRNRTVVGRTEGVFSLQQQVQKHQGQRWELDVVIVPASRTKLDVWWAWLLSLNGREKTVLAPLQYPNEMKGSAMNYTAPEVDGANQTGNSLNIKNAPTSITNYLRAGDYFQLGATGSDARLYMSLEDVNTNGSGQATVTIWPDLYQSPANSATITVASPVGLFRLVENSHEFLRDPSDTRKGLRFSLVGVI